MPDEQTTNERTYGPTHLTLEQCRETHRPQAIQALAHHIVELQAELDNGASREKKLNEGLYGANQDLAKLKGEFIGPVQQTSEQAPSAAQAPKSPPPTKSPSIAPVPAGPLPGAALSSQLHPPTKAKP